MRILLIEDNINDANILKKLLQKNFSQLDIILVDNELDFRKHCSYEIDLILSDYTLPEFSGLKALEIRNEYFPLLPFIIVTGSVNETTAVECLKAGADNYILKENLKRLAEAIKSAIQNKRIEKEKLEAENKISTILNRYNALVEQSKIGILIELEDGNFGYFNEYLLSIFGYSSNEFNKLKFNDLFIVSRDDQEIRKIIVNSKNSDNRTEFEIKGKHANASIIWLSIHKEAYLENGDLKGIQYFIKDITQSKKDKLLIDSINRLARRALIGSDLYDFLNYSYKVIREFIFVDNFFVALYNEENNTYSFPFYIDEKYQLEPMKEYDFQGGLVDLVRKTRESVFVNKEQIIKYIKDGKINEFGAPSEVFAAVPLITNDKVFGVIGMQDYTDKSKITIDELSFLERFAPWVIMKISQEKSLIEIAEREKRFHDLFSSSPSAIIVHQDGIIKMANKAANELAECNADRNLIGSKVIDFVDKSMIERIAERISKVITDSEIQPPIIEKLHTFSGKLIFVEVTAIPFELNGRPASQVIMRDTSDEYLAKEKLLESEQKFRKAFKTSLDVITITEIDTGEYIEVNDAFLEITGYSEEEIIGKYSYDINIWANIKDRENMVSELKKNGYLLNFRTAYRMKDGHIEHALASARIINIDNRKVLILMSRIITDFLNAVHLVEINEQKFNEIFNSASDPIILYKLEDEMIFFDCNKAFEKLYGYSKQEVIGENVSLLTKGIDNPTLNLNINKIKKEKIALFESYHSTREGKKFPVEISAKEISIDGQNYILAIERDISERKMAEEIIKRSEQENKKLWDLFRAIADNVPAMLWAKDLNGNYIFANQFLCDKLLIAKDFREPIGKNDMYFAQRQRNIKPEKIDWYTFGESGMASDKKVLKEKKTLHFDESGYVKGEFIYLDVVKTLLKNSEDKIIGTVGAARDVTKYKEAEKSMIESEEKFHLIFSLSPDALLIINSKTRRPVDLNNRFSELTGYDLQNWPFDSEHIPPFNNISEFENVCKILKDNGELNNYEFQLSLNNEITKNLLISAVNLYLKKEPHVMFVFKDITDILEIQKELEAAIEKAEESDRLKSAFLANMSHEIRTPMNHIIGFTEFIKQGVNETDLHSYIDIIQKSSNHLLDLINDIIDISKIEAGQMQLNITELNATHVLKEVYDQFSFDFRHVNNPDLLFIIDTKFSIDSRVLADRLKLVQVLINLVGNALKFTEKGEIHLGVEIQNEDYIRYYVSDTGCGIAKDDQGLIFERFMQAKGNHKYNNNGTGLGLALSKAFVELMGGVIWVESELNKGSTFYFTIPRSISYGKSKKEEIFENVFKVGIMVISNTDSFLLTTILLSFLNVDQTYSIKYGDLNHLQNLVDIDMLFMDVNDLKKEAKTLFLQIKKALPNLKIVGILSYQLQAYDQKIDKIGFYSFVVKPFTKAKIKDLVQNAIENNEN